LLIIKDNYTLVFQKLIDLIDWNILKKFAYRLDIDYLTIENHLKSLIYFHIAELDSLRDINDFMKSPSELKQLIKGVSLGSLSNYNNKINYEVLLPVMSDIIIKALISIPVSQRIKKFGSVKLIDSTTISMGMTYFNWAKFRSTKAGIKMHTKFDLGKNIPETIIVTNAKVHDKNKLDELMSEENCIYIYDRAYVDYEQSDKYTNTNRFFISRLKKNAIIDEVENLDITYCDEKLLDDKIKIIYDKVVYLGKKSTYKTTEKYRIVKVLDKDNNELVFITNIFYLSTEEIAWLYKKRWEIELFFKWIKQKLKIKKFIGNSLNAVMMQIISAIITFIILRLIQNEINSAYGLTTIKRIIKHSLTNKVSIKEFSWFIFLGS
jgi:hypothetical protein